MLAPAHRFLSQRCAENTTKNDTLLNITGLIIKDAKHLSHFFIIDEEYFSLFLLRSNFIQNRTEYTEFGANILESKSLFKT